MLTDLPAKPNREILLDFEWHLIFDRASDDGDDDDEVLPDFFWRNNSFTVVVQEDATILKMRW